VRLRLLVRETYRITVANGLFVHRDEQIRKTLGRDAEEYG
jgi:hypothetical protein